MQVTKRAAENEQKPPSSGDVLGWLSRAAVTCYKFVTKYISPMFVRVAPIIYIYIYIYLSLSLYECTCDLCPPKKILFYFSPISGTIIFLLTSNFNRIYLYF